MKWHGYVAVALSLVSALSACSAAIAATGTASQDSSEEELEVNMANPWSEATTADEAGVGAFEDAFEVPDDLGLGDIAWFAPRFRYMEGIAEADYEGGAVEAWVRKGKGLSGSDLHGVYTEFELTWTEDVDGMTVSCSGHEEGIANLLEWSDGDYGYTVYLIGLGGENYGVHEEDIADLVSAIK